YPYLFLVHGDADGAANTRRYVIDPSNPSFVACPMGSPSFNTNNMNPCGQVTVPVVGGPAPTYAVSGHVNVDGAGAMGWLVVLERDEPAPSHHFFADRVTTDATGAFSLRAAAGAWRLQAWHPTFLTKNDAQRNPLTLQAQRRLIS